MRNVGALTLVLLTLAGCADTETKSTADTPQPAKQSKATKPAPDRLAGVGDSITLQGIDDKTRMRVKVVRVNRNIPTGEFDNVEGKLIGIELLLTNVGSATYDDSPSNGAALISRGDKQLDPAFITSGPCELWSGAKIRPGARRLGCIPFDLPAGVKAKTFQFSLNSGFGPQSGEWNLGP